ncbi:hypothetical protein NDU88_001173 [Pleurodeles waltl]|uniref:Uncharacterized protein n=1 Tax=Pleurodeles waltl TaxID=8319 RepID=A0AAV7S6Q2_PLEWA|nr:hypothetical protein NDU88_001173 [Pleurodeles waltl]
MAPSGHHDLEEEETFSIADSDEAETEQMPKTVSKTAPVKTHVKIIKAQGTPPPAGHGLTQKISDRPLAPKKGTCRSHPTPVEIPAQNTLGPRHWFRTISTSRYRHRNESAPIDRNTKTQKSGFGAEKDC